MRKIILSLFLLFFAGVSAQSELIFVYFKGKPNAAAFFANPLAELSQKSLNRRAALGIPLNTQDAPIEQSYIQNIKNLGFIVTDYSKWLNGVAVNATASEVALLQSQPYVKNIESFAKNSRVVPKNSIQKIDKFKEFSKSALTIFNYGAGSEQINQVNLRNLHTSGFTGEGITIAVLDTGFPTVNTGTAYQRLWTNNKIKGGYNFFAKTTDIYNTSLNAHGSYVLGVMGGFLDGIFVGSAPDADYYLYATENAAVEIPEEQLYWIMAAEEADRNGVDIINCSLGYATFDDPKYNYNYADMNGKKTFIARGAQIASEKGIIVVASAGNSGEASWHYITSPADNASVFTVGAVTSAGVSSSFSSFGPNSVGIVKPDASARGTAAETAFNNSGASASGTSLSAPIASGGIACLLQAISKNLPRDIIRAKLRETSSLFPNSTDQMGYGILNFGTALQVLQKEQALATDSFLIYPNPADDKIWFKTTETVLNVEIFDESGRLIKITSPQSYFMNISYLTNGVYFLKITTNKSIHNKKIIKN